MTNISVELTAPNGRKYIQPIGLFINNEWHPSSNGEKIASINPTFVYLYSLFIIPTPKQFSSPALPFSSLDTFSHMIALLIYVATEMNQKSHLSTLLQSRMLTKQSLQLGKLSNTPRGAISPVLSVVISC